MNLIGEHTDYNGLPVFPMAIRQSVAIGFRARGDGRVRLANVDPNHPPREFELAGSIPAYPHGNWGNYAKAAAQAVVERYGVRTGLDGAVHGDIPPAAGLSSSSALVVATALALLAANGVEADRAELMGLLAEAERYVGTRSGGMDQAICLGGRRGHAVVIDFEPLRLRPVPIPSDWRFVVANTLVEAKKSGAAQAGYNERVAECRQALRFVGKNAAGRNLPSTYRGLLGSLPPGSLEELATTLPEPLCRRFRHVVTEGARVEEARAAMLEGDLAAFGRLMNASHASLRDDYEVSCPELDALAEAALDAGAAGARLTGAGFGGCVVALCRAARLDALFAAPGAGRGTRGRVPLFLAEACDGARVIEA